LTANSRSARPEYDVPIFGRIIRMIGLTGKDFDIILVSGDPYADHPLSPVGVIARVLEAKGYKVGIIERPDWTSDQIFSNSGARAFFSA